jgi:hypothetical protein
MYIPGMSSPSRRLFVGDLHGCLPELDALLARFAFRPGIDRLFSVGDVAGKGPDVPGTLSRLRELGAEAVLGNHDVALLEAARAPAAGPRPKHSGYVAALGAEKDEWVGWMSGWPYWIDLGDILMVHAGLPPDNPDPRQADPRYLITIRTWDGRGENLNRAGDPPWFACVDPDRIIVFGHWAQRGLVDLPRFKGLDTGCVYGGKLTGWCPEEERFVQVDAFRAYAPIHRH